MSKSMAEEFEKLNLDGGIFVDFEDEVEEMEPGRDHWLTPGDQVTFPNILTDEAIGEDQTEYYFGRSVVDDFKTIKEQLIAHNKAVWDDMIKWPGGSIELDIPLKRAGTEFIAKIKPAARCTCGSHSVDPHLPPERHSTWCDLQGERK
jgi:hypothetical protein